LRPQAPLTDGEWHRLHPATPLLRGGIVVVAILGFVITNLRERLVEFFFGEPHFEGDPLDEIVRRGAVGWALLGIAAVLIIILTAFYASWRMHTFRVGNDAVEVRSGILFRSHRKARLDRIQGVNLMRPFIPRLFGTARLEVSVGGQDGSVQLAYLRGDLADDLRRDILRLASGIRQAAATDTAGPHPGAPTDSLAPGEAAVRSGVAGFGDLASARMHEIMAPQLDPDAAPPQSVVRIPTGRLIGSIVLSGFTVFLLAAAGALVVGVVNGGSGWLLFAILPGIIGSVGYYWSRITKSLRYSISGTSDGVRVGFGLLSTSSETLPPGRIHAIGVSQPLLWRPFGWWQVQINKAGQSVHDAGGAASALMLPVGTEADVERVLELLLPGFSTPAHRHLVQQGMAGTGTRTDERRHPNAGATDDSPGVGVGLSDGFTNAPRRARWLRPFSWRRTGYAVSGGVALLRHGVISRDLILVPLARLQSVGIDQGAIKRRLGLASARLHTVTGPVTAQLGVLDADEAKRMFARISSDAATFAATDTSHRWNQNPAVSVPAPRTGTPDTTLPPGPTAGLAPTTGPAPTTGLAL
jgi:putative membrane protein